MLRIIRGDASPEEVAAIVAVLALRAKTATGGPARPRTVSTWSDRSRMMREAISPSPAGWRRSAFPR
ncbi:MAG TPA: acyl-CoA carboxylase subunit epsilon [Streptosporangiaceae bacterium]|nr:acyl-CoA carboxylase subunit epsilon [Streptosporangiaceae bacterium]